MAFDAIWFHEATRMVSDLEHGIVRFDEGIYRPQIERLISELMDRTFETGDDKEKTLLAVLELRARNLCECWLKDKTRQN